MAALTAPEAVSAARAGSSELAHLTGWIGRMATPRQLQTAFTKASVRDEQRQKRTHRGINHWRKALDAEPIRMARRQSGALHGSQTVSHPPIHDQRVERALATSGAVGWHLSWGSSPHASEVKGHARCC